MDSTTRPTLRDRADDSRPQFEAGDKPSVLRRSTQRLLCLLTISAIVYGTLGPLGYGSGAWIAPAEEWSWTPTTTLVDRGDVITNLAVFIPVGLALRILLRRRGRAGPEDLILAVGISAMMSYLIELCQQWLPARSASMLDVGMNTLGAMIGCALAPIAQQCVRRGHEELFERSGPRPWSVAAFFTSFLTLLLMTVPWLPAWPVVEINLLRRFDLIDVQRCGAFMLVGFTSMMAFVERYGDSPFAVRRTIRKVLLMAIVLESAQIILLAHVTGLLDIIIATFGGLVGCAIARWLMALGLFEAPPPGEIAVVRKRPRRLRAGALRVAQQLALGAILASVGYLIYVGVHRPNTPALGPGALNILLMPFQVHFLKSFDVVVSDFVQKIILSAFVTAMCLFVTGGRGRALALMLLMGLTILIELYQGMLVGGVADVTPLLLVALGWFVAVRIWAAFHPPETRYRPSAEPKNAHRAPLPQQL